MHNRRRPRMSNKILLRLEERAEYRGPPILEVDFPLESAFQQSLDSLLRFRPRQRGLKGVEGVEEPVGGWQRDLVDEILRCRDRTPIEGGDPAGQRVDEAIQLRVGKCPVDVSVSLRGVAVEVVRAENDFERAAATDQMWEAFRRATRSACRRRGRTRCSHPGRSLGSSRC
jgi:hypothetical protein